MNIAVSGASGAIGSRVCKYLLQMNPDINLRLGCRNRTDEIKKLEESSSNIEWIKVDTSDKNSVLEFIKGQDVLINAAGSSGDSGLDLAETVVPVCSLVDVGYNQEYEKVNHKKDSNFCVFGAGSAPGYLGILTRVCAEKCGNVKSRRLWYLIREKISRSAARDLAKLFRNKNGKITDRLPDRSDPVQIPFFDESVYPFQYYDVEAQTVDKICGIKKSETYMLREDDDLYYVGAKYAGREEELTQYFIQAAELMQADKKSMMRVLAEFQGDKNLTVLAQSATQSDLSGCVAAATALAILEEKSEPCWIRSAEFEGYKKCFELMSRTDVMECYEEYPNLIDDFYEEEAGEI